MSEKKKIDHLSRVPCRRKKNQPRISIISATYNRSILNHMLTTLIGYHHVYFSSSIQDSSIWRLYVLIEVHIKYYKFQASPFCGANHILNFRAEPNCDANRLGLIAVHKCISVTANRNIIMIMKFQKIQYYWDLFWMLCIVIEIRNDLKLTVFIHM